MTTIHTETSMDQNADLPVRPEPGEEQTLQRALSALFLVAPEDVCRDVRAKVNAVLDKRDAEIASLRASLEAAQQDSEPVMPRPIVAKVRAKLEAGEKEGFYWNQFDLCDIRGLIDECDRLAARASRSPEARQ